MRLPVGWIVELIGEIIAFRGFTSHGIGSLNGTVGGFFCRGEDDLGTIGQHDLPPLDAGRLGHDQAAAVSPGSTDHGKANAGVSAGSLKQDGVTGQFAALLSSLNHG